MHFQEEKIADGLKVSVDLEPKRQRLDDDADENLAGNESKIKRLAQLKKDIAILEAAVRRGQETMEKMLNIAVEDINIDPLVTVQVN